MTMAVVSMEFLCIRKLGAVCATTVVVYYIIFMKSRGEEKIKTTIKVACSVQCNWSNTIVVVVIWYVVYLCANLYHFVFEKPTFFACTINTLWYYFVHQISQIAASQFPCSLSSSPFSLCLYLFHTGTVWHSVHIYLFI